MKAKKAPFDSSYSISKKQISRAFTYYIIGLFSLLILFTGLTGFIEFFIILTNNPIPFLLNTTQAFFGVLGVFNFAVLPLWRFVFIDRAKVGQKIEWYSERWKHLTPETRKFLVFRLTILIGISLFFVIYTYSNNGNNILFLMGRFIPCNTNLAELIVLNKILKNDLAIYLTQLILSFFSVFYVLFNFEVRSRVLTRLHKVFYRRYIEIISHSPLPKNPWDENSEKFHFCIFTVFNPDQPDSLKASRNEKWWIIDYKQATGNIYIYGPTGDGKTQSSMKPLIHQTIWWQRKCPVKKASTMINDPKFELTSFIVDEAKKAGREKDLLILSPENDDYGTNIISTGNTWSTNNNLKVTNWIVNAWRNYQGNEASKSDPYWEDNGGALISQVFYLTSILHGDESTIEIIGKWWFSLQGSIIKTDFDSRGQRRSYVEKEGIKIYAALMACGYYLGNDDDVEILLGGMGLYIGGESEEDELNAREDLNKCLGEEYGELLERKKETEEKLGKWEMANRHEDTISPAIEQVKINLKKEIDKINKSIKKIQTEQEWKIREILLVNKVKDLAKEVYSNREKDLLVQEDQCSTFFDEAYSSILKLISFFTAEDNRNKFNILSTFNAFFTNINSPGIRKVLSSKKNNVPFSTIVDDGTIFVPNFNPKDIGENMSNAVITLLKARWQEAVISINNGSENNNPRPKVNLSDESQKILIFGGGKVRGDDEYLEVSRSVGGVTVGHTQGASSVKAIMKNQHHWDKLHGIIKTSIFLKTKSPEACKEASMMGGEKSVLKLSRTITEGASSPESEALTDKYSGDNSSLSLSFTESKTKEKRISEGMIQQLYRNTAVMIADIEDDQLVGINDGNEEADGMSTDVDNRNSQVRLIGLKPIYWKSNRYPWWIMKLMNYNPENSPPALFKILLKVYNFFEGGK